MKNIIKYLEEKYNPEVLIVYGSFANNTNDINSDFDALVITKNTTIHYDNSVVDGTFLDVFIYEAKTIETNFNLEDFVMIYDSKIVLDKHGLGSMMKEKVIDYIDNYPKLESEEVLHLVTWCDKMLTRAKRGDAEGFYRWHWVLIDSLKIYFDLLGKYYFGPKKSLEMLKAFDNEAYVIYTTALKRFDMDSLSAWIQFMKYKKG